MTFRINKNRLAELEYEFATDKEALSQEALIELVRLLQKTILNERENPDIPSMAEDMGIE